MPWIIDVVCPRCKGRLFRDQDGDICCIVCGNMVLNAQQIRELQSVRLTLSQGKKRLRNPSYQKIQL